MSGGGGGGPPTWPEEPVPKCEELTFETTLSSPQAAVVAELKEGDELLVQLETADGTSRIVARHEDGRPAGTITTGEFVSLLRCLQQGFDFRAEVIEVVGGMVRVRIRPA